MKKIGWSIFFLLFMWGGAVVRANDGIPGVSVFFEHDSVYYSSVQLKQKNILADLYQETAAVRSIYTFYNPSDTQQRVAVGFPKGILKHKPVVYLNEKPVSVRQCEKNTVAGMENWYVWEVIFDSKDTTVVEIYTMAGVAPPAKKEAQFCLLPDSSGWMKMLPYGSIAIYLKDDLTEKDLSDVSPGYFKTKQGEWLFYEYTATNSSVLYEQVCIRYQLRRVAEILPISEQRIQGLWDELKNYSGRTEIDRSSLRPLEIGHGSGDWLVLFLRYGLLLGVPLLLLGISLGTAYIIVRRAKQKKDIN